MDTVMDRVDTNGTAVDKKKDDRRHYVTGKPTVTDDEDNASV
jgi:hypothetical protein